MQKARAIDLLGGSPVSAADAVGCSVQAISKWPDILPQRIADRVVAALVRQGKSARFIRAAIEAAEPVTNGPEVR